jgi:hypothetical protein
MFPSLRGHKSFDAPLWLLLHSKSSRFLSDENDTDTPPQINITCEVRAPARA